MLAVVQMPQASADPFQCDRDSDNLNNFLNDIVDHNIIASNLQMFSVNSPHISAESINPICIGLFLHPICRGGGGGGKFAPYLKTVW